MKPCKCYWCNTRPTIRLERTWLGLVGVAECKPTCIAPSISVRADTPDEAFEAVRRLWDKNNQIEEVTCGGQAKPIVTEGISYPLAEYKCVSCGAAGPRQGGTLLSEERRNAMSAFDEWAKEVLAGIKEETKC